MEMSSRQLGEVRILSVRGRIDHACAESFQQAMAAHLAECRGDRNSLVLDFGGVDYVSSVGLRALMLAAKQVKAQSGRIAIAALTPMVAEVFQISRFNLVFSTFETVEGAVAGLVK